MVNKDNLVAEGLILSMSSPWLNPRLFTGILTNTMPQSMHDDFQIEDMPQQVRIYTGSILWWGTDESSSHLAVALDENMLIQLPRKGADAEIRPIFEIEYEFGKIARIYQSKLQKQYGI